jgi:hypothetical protein
MGHRQYHQEYKKRIRVPDNRESIVINKIALEYRRMRALQNGGHEDSLFKQHEKEFRARLAGHQH